MNADIEAVLEYCGAVDALDSSSKGAIGTFRRPLRVKCIDRYKFNTGYHVHQCQIPGMPPL